MLLLTLLMNTAVGQTAPACTPELSGVLFDFGTTQAPRLFKCDGRSWAVWPVPPALCAPAQTPPPPTPPVTPQVEPQPGSPPPLPGVSPTVTSETLLLECRQGCSARFSQCVRNKCVSSLAASCKQECDRIQTRCVTGCK